MTQESSICLRQETPTYTTCKCRNNRTLTSLVAFGLLSTYIATASRKRRACYMLIGRPLVSPGFASLAAESNNNNHIISHIMQLGIILIVTAEADAAVVPGYRGGSSDQIFLCHSTDYQRCGSNTIIDS
jgi:hypothetical protein